MTYKMSTFSVPDREKFWEPLSEKLLNLSLRVFEERKSDIAYDRKEGEGIVKVLKDVEVKKFSTLADALSLCVQNLHPKKSCSEVFDMNYNKNLVGAGYMKEVYAFKKYNFDFVIKFIERAPHWKLYRELSIGFIAALAGIGPLVFCKESSDEGTKIIEERVNTDHVAQSAFDGSLSENSDSLKSALTRFHKLGLAHKDLKIDNIGYFESTGKYCLVDFGESIPRTNPKDPVFYSVCLFDWSLLGRQLGDIGDIEFVSFEEIQNRTFEQLFEIDVLGLIEKELLSLIKDLESGDKEVFDKVYRKVFDSIGSRGLIKSFLLALGRILATRENKFISEYGVSSGVFDHKYEKYAKNLIRIENLISNVGGLGVPKYLIDVDTDPKIMSYFLKSYIFWLVAIPITEMNPTNTSTKISDYVQNSIRSGKPVRIFSSDALKSEVGTKRIEEYIKVFGKKRIMKLLRELQHKSKFIPPTKPELDWISKTF